MFELFDPEADFRVTGGANLPHWYQPGVTYFVTFRTDDSIPIDVARRWYAERADWLKQRGISTADAIWKDRFSALPREQRLEYHNTFSRRYMLNLDKGWGACVLSRPELSSIVVDSLLHFNGLRYQLGDFVVMPNHVHLLVCLATETDILDQCYSWKRFTAGRINKVLCKSGRFWQEESFDHLVRSPEQFQAIQRYIADNPKDLLDGRYHLHQL